MSASIFSLSLPSLFPSFPSKIKNKAVISLGYSRVEIKEDKNSCTSFKGMLQRESIGGVHLSKYVAKIIYIQI